MARGHSSRLSRRSTRCRVDLETVTASMSSATCCVYTLEWASGGPSRTRQPAASAFLHGQASLAEKEYYNSAPAVRPYGTLSSVMSKTRVALGGIPGPGLELPYASSGGMTIRADLLARSDAGCAYDFAVHDALGCRARGRLLVAFGHDG